MNDFGERFSSSVPVKRTLSNSIEIPLLVNVVAVSLTGVALNNILLYRACAISLSISKAECEPFLSPTKNNGTALLEKEVQAYVTFVLTIKTVLEYIGPAILSAFLGPWSDTYGRKPLLTSPLFGMAITGILIVVYATMDSLGPWWFILTVIPFSFSGGIVVLMTGAYCYVSDTSTIETTSLRMTIVDATMSLGVVMGTLTSSYLIITFGNIYLLLLAATLNVIAYAFANIVIAESLVGALEDGLKKVLNISLVQEMIRECSKARPNHARAQIILISLVKVLILIIFTGTDLLEYLYVREKLHWALQEYTTYSAVSMALAFVGGFLGVMVVQKLLRLSDVAFSILTLLTAILEYVLKMLVTTSLVMYLSK